jgi:hypothetical protein
LDQRRSAASRRTHSTTSLAFPYLRSYWRRGIRGCLSSNKNNDCERGIGDIEAASPLGCLLNSVQRSHFHAGGFERNSARNRRRLRKAG